MNTDRPKRLRVPLLVSCAAIVLAGAGDVHVSCSPTLTCALRPERFAPPPDAGSNTCEIGREPCALKQISLGSQHTCARTEEDNAICWGDNSRAQRGATQAGRVQSDRYAHVLDLVLQVSAGAEHSCAVTHDGSVSCWGSRAHGQLDGRVDPVPYDSPEQLELPHVWAVSAGAAHTCAIAGEFVWCWGSSEYGQSGRLVSKTPLLPGKVPLTHEAVEIACGVRHTCTRLNTQEVLCWGELIDSQGNPYTTTEPTLMFSGATRIAAGGGHTCATNWSDGVFCWGRNESGQLGDGTTRASGVPVRATLDSVVNLLAAGGGERDGALFGQTCVIAAAGGVYCWGDDRHGQLGIGAGADRPLPVQVLNEDGLPFINVFHLSLGATHGCVMSLESELSCWGDDSHHQLGLDLSPTTARPTSNVPSKPVRIPSFGVRGAERADY